MLSKGGKIEYRCPDCHSRSIYQAEVYGQNSYVCRTCTLWGPWRERFKESLRNKNVNQPTKN